MKTFALRNYAGKETKYFSVETGVASSKIKPSLPSATHHIIIVDRSGSMYYLMKNLRSVLIDSLASVGNQSNIHVSMISYSSEGNVTTHFVREPLSTVNKADSKPQREIRNLSTGGLTCISQALEDAQALIQEGEPTAVTLHSDGYANDDSSYSERRELDEILPEFKAAGVPVHTVAHSSYSDFQTLNRIAKETGGSCSFARETAHVLEPIAKNTASLGGELVSVPVSIESADYLVVVDPSTRRVLSSKSDMLVLQVSDPSALQVLRFSEIDKSAYNRGTQLDQSSDVAEHLPIYAYSMASLSEGALNDAKYALISTRNESLINEHYRALVNEDLALMAAGLNKYIFDNGRLIQSAEFGLQQNGTDLLNLSLFLHLHRQAITVDIEHLRSVYTYRGLKTIPGYRDANGRHIKPEYATKPKSNDPFQEVVGVEINKNTANINMTVQQPVHLCENTSAQKIISSVEGVDLDELKEYRAFTLVGDGRLNVPTLKLKFAKASAFNTFKFLGIVSGTFSADQIHVIDLQSLPMVPTSLKFEDLKNTFNLVAGGRLLSLILAAMLKGGSTTLTGTQIKALRSYGISASLNVNIRSCNEVADLDEALDEGKVDKRPSYNIDIGTTQIQNIKDFRTTTKILQTFYKVNGKTKSKWTDVWDPSSTIEKKKLSKRTKVSTADEFSVDLVDQLLGLKAHDGLQDLLAGLEVTGHEDTLRALTGRTYKMDTFRADVEAFQEAIEDAVDSIYAKQISPLVFYIGSTGLIPDEYKATRYDAEALLALYPHLKIDKGERDGSFFVFEDDIISVYMEDEWISIL